MKQREVTTGQSWLYGVGNVANNLIFLFVGTYVMFYYTNIMGLDSILAGTIFMVARLVDAITDPIMGMIVDRTNTRRWGKYRPFIQFGAPFLGVVLVVMFSAPPLSTGMKILYAYTSYILYSLVWTCVQTPQLALPAIMSTNLAKRAKIQAIFQGVGAVGAIGVTALALPLLNHFGGQQDPAAWRMTSIVIAVAATILFELSLLSVRRLDVYNPREAQARQEEKRDPTQKMSMGQRVRIVCTNAAMIAILVSFGTDMLAGQIGQSVNMYFFTYNMNGRTDLMIWLSLISMPLTFGMIFVVAPFLNRFGKKKGIILCEVVSIALMIGLYFTPATNVWLVMAWMLLANLPMMFCNTLCRAAILDAASYTKWKKGIDATALISSTFTFVNKVAQAVAGFVLGYSLQWIGFNSAAPVQSANTLHGLLLMKTALPIAAYICTLIAMRFYPLSKKGEEEMQQALDEIETRELQALAARPAE